MQNNSIINGTIKSNIAYSTKNKKHSNDIIHYSKLAYSHEFIKSFKNGYNTIIGEKGTNLSGGQKQRIDIARSFIKEPNILLLDEATSNLDSESENVIQQSIKNISQNRTTIIVAHRLSTIINADKIIFIDSGQVTGSGTHDELLTNHQKYKQMVELQGLYKNK